PVLFASVLVTSRAAETAINKVDTRTTVVRVSRTLLRHTTTSWSRNSIVIQDGHAGCPVYNVHCKVLLPVHVNRSGYLAPSPFSSRFEVHLACSCETRPSTRSASSTLRSDAVLYGPAVDRYRYFSCFSASHVER